MNRFLLVFGTILLIPGMVALYGALSQGPSSWGLSQTFFWGTPIANFVFWIGLAHAGTFLSAILLVLGVKWQHRVALMAELSTLAALLVAVIFPLMHLGHPLRFYEMLPQSNARAFWANIESPLVWDFLSIFAYLVSSSVFLALHLLKNRFPPLQKFLLPMAWVLFPLVLWVHTIVSLDFAVTFVPHWQGAYFPLYFIVGALYSGLGLVLVLVEFSGKRVRHLEDFLLSFSWAMLAFWLWEAFSKGIWQPELLPFGFLIPQLLWIPQWRERRALRILICFSVLGILWWERIVLVQREPLAWTWVDWGLISWGVGMFCVVFASLRVLLRRFFPESLTEVSELPPEEKSNFPKKDFAASLALGVIAAGIFAICWVNAAPDFPWLRMVPALFPIAAVVAVFGLALMAGISVFGIRRVVPFALAFGLFALATDCFVYRGAPTSYAEDYSLVKGENVLRVRSSGEVAFLWNARCAACHAKDGSLNRRFVHEYYPLPQELSLSRLDSLGEDSLVQVVLHGRNYMQPFAGRVSESEAQALVRYIKELAKKKEAVK